MIFLIWAFLTDNSIMIPLICWTVVANGSILLLTALLPTQPKTSKREDIVLWIMALTIYLPHFICMLPLISIELLTKGKTNFIEYSVKEVSLSLLLCALGVVGPLFSFALINY